MRNVASPREIFLRGVEIFLRGLVTCHWPFRFYSTATHLAPYFIQFLYMEAILLFIIHSSTCTAVNTGFWFLDAAKFYEILRNAFKLCEMHEFFYIKRN
jgi:uncharacterized protein (UPF0262 family)